MTESSGYTLEPLREGPDFTLYRGRQRGSPWYWPSPENSRRLGVSGGLSTSTRSQPNSIPHGRPCLWRLLVTKGGRYSYSRTLAVSP